MIPIADQYRSFDQLLAFIKQLHHTSALREAWRRTGAKSMKAIKGIRWNNKHEVAERAVENKEALLKFLASDKGGTFDDNALSVSDLRHLERMCSITKLFLEATRKMEQRGPTASEVLVLWRQLAKNLADKALKFKDYPELDHAIAAAIQKTQDYESLSLLSKPVLICTSTSSPSNEDLSQV